MYKPSGQNHRKSSL